MSIRQTAFLTMLLSISICCIGNDSINTNAKVSQVQKLFVQGCLLATNTIKIHPKKTALLAVGAAGIGARLLYNKNRAMQAYVHRAHANLVETSDNVYYDVLDKVCMPIMCEWQELAETPFSTKDAAYTGVAIGSLWSMTKINQKYHLVQKTKTFVTENSPLFMRHIGYAQNALYNSCRFFAKSMHNTYTNNKKIAHISASVAALGTLGYVVHRLLSDTSCSYVTLFPPFWATFTSEQTQKLEHDHLDLVIRAQDNPMELLACESFMNLLTESQNAALEKIILQYTKEIKQLKEQM